MPSPNSDTRVCHRIWDLPTRAFHWLLVLAIVTALATGLIESVRMYEIQVGNRFYNLHIMAGYVVMTLILFRLVWGVIGTQTARFTDFVPGPRRLLNFLTGRGDNRVMLGHNPLGAFSVLGMLAVISIQFGTGLYAHDDIFVGGPLSDTVSRDTRTLLTAIHIYNANLLMALIGLHLAAISFYAVVKRQNLVTPMFTGRRCLHPDQEVDKPGLRFAPWWQAVLVAVAAIAITTWIVNR